MMSYLEINVFCIFLQDPLAIRERNHCPYCMQDILAIRERNHSPIYVYFWSARVLSNNSPMIFENLFSSNIQRIKKKESNQIKSTAIIEFAPPTRNLKHRPCNKISNPTMVSFLSPASQFTNKYQVSNLSTCSRKLLFSSLYHPSIYPSISASNLVRVFRLSFEITCLRESRNIFTCRCFAVSCWPLWLRSILAGRIWLVFFCALSHSRPYLQSCFPFRSHLWVHHFLVHIRLCITPGSWMSRVRQYCVHFVWTLCSGQYICKG